MNPRDKLLESIDIDIFLEYHYPGEWERYGDKERAFDNLTEYMTPQELIKALDESGCWNEDEELNEQKLQEWAAAIDNDPEWIAENF